MLWRGSPRQILAETAAAPEDKIGSAARPQVAGAEEEYGYLDFRDHALKASERDPPPRDRARFSPRRALPVLAAAAVMGMALWTARVNFISEIRTVFRDAPLRVIAPELRTQVAALKAKMPAGAPIFYFDQYPRDHWRSRLWQRAFYPARLIILEQEKASERPPLAALRQVHAVRFALAAGNPPNDPGFAWHEVLPPLPGTSSTVWFGELKP